MDTSAPPRPPRSGSADLPATPEAALGGQAPIGRGAVGASEAERWRLPEAGRVALGQRRPAIGLAQTLRALTGILWIFWGLRLFASTFAVPGTNAAAIAGVVAGVAVIGLALAPLPRCWERALDGALLVGTLAAFAIWIYAQIYGSPEYGTDEVALQEGAALEFLAGHDPYAVDLSRYLDQFSVPPVYTTYTLDGGRVEALTYPALSFLLYVPLVTAGVTAQAPIIADAGFWVFAMALCWFLLPARLRPLAPLVASLSFYIEYVAGGVSDSLFLPFLLLAAWRWDRFGDPGERSAARWIGPVALGLACDVKQAPWFAVPFLFVGIVLEARAASARWWRRPLAYVCLLLAAFLAPNGWFMIWNPAAWLKGALGPIAMPLVPFGQALIGLSLYLGVGGGRLALYTLAGGLVALCCCLALAGWYPRCKQVLLVFPAVAFLFPTRSLSNYFLFALPGILLGAVTVAGVARRDATRYQLFVPPRAWRAGAVLAGLGAAITLVAAAAWPQPLALTVVGEHATGEMQSLDRLTVRVINRSSRAVTPHFTTSRGPYFSTPWVVLAGPATLAPRGTATYQLWAPNVQSMPGISEGFKLYAMADRPASLSVSALYRPTEDHAQIIPQAVPRAVARGEKIALDVRVLDRLGRPVRRAGMAVALGQVIYAQEGLFPSETSINGHAEGQSPVQTVTDASGAAHFTVQVVQVQPYTIFYQAWLVGAYPTGYSNIVSVHYAGQ